MGQGVWTLGFHIVLIQLSWIEELFGGTSVFGSAELRKFDRFSC